MVGGQKSAFIDVREVADFVLDKRRINNWRMVNITNSRWRWLIIVVVFLVAVAAAVIGSLRPASNVTITNLNHVGELREQFNRDAGKVRVLLLLAPT